MSFQDYAYMETRYKMLTKSNPEAAKQLMAQAEMDVKKRWKMYEEMAQDGAQPAKTAPEAK